MNELEVRPPKDYLYVNEAPSNHLTVEVKPSYADLPQVVGPRYIPDDFKLRAVNNLGHYTSGILRMYCKKSFLKNIYYSFLFFFFCSFSFCY